MRSNEDWFGINFGLFLCYYFAICGRMCACICVGVCVCWCTCGLWSILVFCYDNLMNTISNKMVYPSVAEKQHFNKFASETFEMCQTITSHPRIVVISRELWSFKHISYFSQCCPRATHINWSILTTLAGQISINMPRQYQ